MGPQARPARTLLLIFMFELLSSVVDDEAACTMHVASRRSRRLAGGIRAAQASSTDLGSDLHVRPPLQMSLVVTVKAEALRRERITRWYR